MSLADFLLARFDADEAIVRGLLAAHQRQDRHRGSSMETWSNSDYLEEGISLSPERALAEIEAKRRIIEWCTEVLRDRDLANYGEFGALRDDPKALAVTLAVETLRALTLPYADHPDCRDEWRP